MKRSIKILLAIVILFIVIQLIPRDRNESGNVMNDITKTYPVPGNIQAIFKNSCYDCHSNHTNYPWYASIQPLRYMLDSHIKEGKADLNFNEFGTYSKRKQKSKLWAIGNSLKEGTMPIASYLFIHHDARLSATDQSLIINWTSKMNDTSN